MGRHEVGVREARKDVRQLLDEVKAGDEVIVLRRGFEVGRLIRPERKAPPLPALSRFRASCTVRGKPLSECVVEARRRSCY